MRILFVAAEAVPYVKVGGLGDVAGALPRALAALGHDVRLVVPVSAGVRVPADATVVWRGLVRNGARRARVRVHATELPGPGAAVAVLLVEAPAVLGRASVYGGADEADRFVVFVRAVLASAAADGWTADIVHAHDWHAALLPALLRSGEAEGTPLAAARTVLTIHNLAYQGHQGAGFAARHGLAPPPVPGDGGADHVNPFGRGLAAADRVTTVSPTYAREILAPEYGCGLDPLLRARGDVAGIVNGLDVDVFDPAHDVALASPFDAERLPLRALNRAALARELGLADADEAPLIGMVARLVHQKGFDLALAVAPALLERGARIVLLGTGEPGLEAAFRDLAVASDGRAVATIGFDAALAQRIYAGSDLFLMPSRFEPCGLGQLIAMRYGAIPVVRRTGGLVDTVPDDVGFGFDDATPAALEAACVLALAAFADREQWVRRQQAAMALDHSWSASARAYVELYEDVTRA